MITFNGYRVKIHKRTNIKNISVTFKNKELVVFSPKYLNEKSIQNIMENNKVGIENIISEALILNVAEEEKYIDNSIHKIWGKNYHLRIMNDKKNDIRVLNNKIIIRLKNITVSNVKKELEKLYRIQLNEKIRILVPRIEKMMFLYPNEIRIKNMKTRWGSCNVKEKRIWINLQLAKYSEECLFYVLIHEFTHLEIKNHNKSFYEKVYKFCPNYKEIEALLKK